jgi:hypothetical protein
MNKSKTIERSYWVWYFAIAVVYLIAPLFTPLSAASLERFPEFASNPLFARLVQLSVSLPVLFIWLSAVYGVSKFKSYAHSIKDSEDGKGLNVVATGLTVLVFGGLAMSAFGALWSLILGSAPNPTRTITTNYLNLAYNFIGFAIMLKGSGRLVELVKAKAEVKKSIMVSIVPFAAFAGLYAWLTFHNPYRNMTPQPGRISSLYLPDPLIVLTLMIPYILMWATGSLTAINLMTYRKLAKGTIYKQALSRLALGTFLVIVFSISMQLLGTAASAFANLDLSGILAFIFVILIAYACCYLVIASGARKLKKIEEVQ